MNRARRSEKIKRKLKEQGSDNFLRYCSFIDSLSSNLKQQETQSSDLLQREIES